MKPLTILVVDDDRDMRLYVRGCLRGLEGVAQVLEAADGREALRRVRTGQVDLVVSDVGLPHLDGRGLVEAIRKDPGAARVPVLLIGGEEPAGGWKGPLGAWLAKPFNARQLLSALEPLALKVRTHAITTTEQTLALVTRFENGFNTRDVDALMADMTEDCVFEHVAPAEAGFGRHEGAEAVRAVWESMDEHFPGYTQEVVDIFAAEERACCRFILRWTGADGREGVLRGTDVLTVRDGKVAEKLTYGTL